jgi:RNA polymerase sigma-70 factor (ECF subfamily)
VDPADTQALVKNALGGNHDARGALLERLRPRLVLWAATRLSDALRAKVEPEDVAQEVLLAVHKDLDDFQGTDQRAFLGWMFRVAENRIRDLVDHFGAQKRQPVSPLSFSQTSPSSHAARIESVARLHRSLASLPEDYRRVIQHRRIEERDVGDVALLMERSENAVRVLYCRALQALKEAMERDGETPARPFPPS